MPRLPHVYRLAVKELWSLWRDPMLLFLIVYSFTVSVYIAATAMPETLHHVPIAIVDEDGSPLSTRITNAFRPPYFSPPEPIPLGTVDPSLDDGRYTFVLDVPPDFQRDVLAGHTPEVQLNVDATRMSQAFAGSAAVQQIVLAEVDEFVTRQRGAASAPVGLALRARFNPALDRAWFGSLSDIISKVTMLSIVLTGAALIREREHGTVEHLLVMPVTPLEIMLSKIVAMSVIVLAAAAASLALIVRGALAVPIEGSVTLFLAGAAAYLYAATSLGILLATIARSMPQFGMLLMLVLLPLQVLSGSVTPRESMPEAVRTLMLAAPNTHFVELAQAVLFRAAGLDVVWPQFAALAAIGTALFVLSAARFRRTVTQTT